jgi:hypothetical protein
MKTTLLTLAACAGLTACADLGPAVSSVLDGVAQQQHQDAGPISETDIAAGLKEALATGTTRAIAHIGVTDGFWKNPNVQIPLPDQLQRVEKTLRMLGQGARVDEFHLSLNRAAEQAVPEAAGIFGNAIRAMTLADARGILRGGSTAATDFFKGKTSAALTAKFAPMVAKATGAVGVTRKYKDLAGKVGKLAPGFQLQDIDAYVTQRALEGLFSTLGDEEMRIRQDPGARTTELLKKVFGGVS